MTTSNPAIPDPQYIFDILEGYRRSKVLFTAVKFGIFDILNGRTLSAEQLADEIRKQPDTTNSIILQRLLNACVALGLLNWSNGQYINSDVAREFLVSTNPNSVVAIVKHNDRVSYKLWLHTDDAIIQGTNRWAEAFPLEQPTSELFDYHYRNDTIQQNFVDGMHNLMKVSSPKVIDQFDLSLYRHLVDLGGSSGQLAVTACLRYPQLSATIFDLPNVEPFASKHIFDVNLGGRINFKAGDFFKDDLPKGDLYALGRILHDWPDEKNLIILKKIYEALPENGALLVIETILDEDKMGPLSTLLQDLNMLMATEGFERSASEYEQLLTKAGFKQVEAKKTGTCSDIIRAIK